MNSKVLYVDDESDIREIALLALELDPALVVRVCASGQEALDMAQGWKPDLILLDVMMPHMDGPTTLSRLRDQSQLAHTPVVFITARTQATECEWLLNLGASGVIAKPFDPMTLANDVRVYLDA